MESVIWRCCVTSLAGGKFLEAGHASESGVVFKLVYQAVEHFSRLGGIPIRENSFAARMG